MNIAKKMKEILPELNKGLSGIEFYLKPECADSWNEEYAIVEGLYYDSPSDYGMPYFDQSQFEYDFEQKVKSYFPECNVKFYWKSQEIEVSK